MITQKHREFEKSEKNGCFIVAKSEKEMLNDLNEFAKANQDKKIYYYIHPVRPSKDTLRPEYMMEVELKPKDEHPGLMLLWNRYY